MTAVWQIVEIVKVLYIVDNDKPSDYVMTFTESAQLGRFSHRVAMSVCLDVWMFASEVQFFRGLLLALHIVPFG